MVINLQVDDIRAHSVLVQTLLTEIGYRTSIIYVMLVHLQYEMVVAWLTTLSLHSCTDLLTLFCFLCLATIQFQTMLSFKLSSMNWTGRYHFIATLCYTSFSRWVTKKLTTHLFHCAAYRIKLLDQGVTGFSLVLCLGFRMCSVLHSKPCRLCKCEPKLQY
jgi:hypothetical protein